MRCLSPWLAALVCTFAVGLARAEDAVVPAAPAGRTQVEQKPATPFTLGAYVEAFYQWNFNRPSNGITNYRGFDNRHDSFTIGNAALDAQWDYENVIGRLTLQVGHTPSTYYAAEPSQAGSAGANSSGSELWKYLQQAYAGYRFPRDVTLTAGLFLSPIGPESMAVRDNWNWSRSNLFFGCPFYHTGARASYALTEHWLATLATYNGWNSVVDNNSHKSLSGQLVYTQASVSLSMLYFGGVERARGAPEGQPWRHLFDSYATWHVHRALSLMAHVNAGFEQTREGAERWAAAALYARAKLVEQLYLAARADVFRERVPGGASPIFWPVSYVSSLTGTLDYRPHPHVSLRAEYRYDHAAGAMFFGGQVRMDENTSFIANRKSQNTATLGVTTWF